MRALSLTIWRTRVIGCCTAVLVAAGVLAAPALPTAQACDTPVYRYAMYNWPSMPYRIFYYHHGQPAETDAEVNRTLEKLASGEPAANVLLQPVDVSKTEQFEQYPKPVVDAWRAHGKDDSTLHVVFSPWAAEVFGGRLDAAAVEAMVDSPARKRLGELLHQGNVVVWLMLTGTDAEENARAEKVAKEVTAAALTGKIGAEEEGVADAAPNQTPAGESAAGAPKGEDAAAKPEGESAVAKPEGGAADAASKSNATAAASGGDDPTAGPKGLKVALLKVSRTDPAETWLVRSLLAIEPDLEKLTAEPMIFGVYGRGRAIPPCVGKGITTENLIDCLMFLSGPCSCMIKDQNPGADLLMRWDWDATAEALAIEEEQQMNVGPQGDREPGPVGSAAIASTEGSAPQAADAAAMAGAPDGDKPEEPAEATASPDSDKPADAAETAQESQTKVAVASSFSTKMAWRIGIALAVGGVFVVAAGLVLLRLQRRGA